MSESPVVIVGAGHAGFTLALMLRARGWEGGVVLVSDEDELPYQRPPLSKEYLHAGQDEEETRFRPAAFYSEQRIELVLGARVVEIDRAGRNVVFADGTRRSFAHLVLATGARARELRVRGYDADGVVSLRTRPEAVDLRARLDAARSVAVVGGGFIGLEVAAASAELGLRVTVLEAQPRLMARSLSHDMAEHLLALHRRAGVDVRLSSAVDAIATEGGRVTGVLTREPDTVPADIVVVGIGAVPNDELAASCGLPVRDGVLVDAQLLTADPAISAIGDCARFPGPGPDGAGWRLESVQNATDQARYVADRLINGSTQPYWAVPWFWTEQFGQKLQIAGLAAGYDELRTERVREDKFSVYCSRGGTLLACESINAPGDHLRARKALAAALTNGGG
ncbi:FAD-dependent oxidoreductase [Dactylosporangium sp. NPDC051484]|uniref:NAD(P)/FAD-dependent oxidoreductase n=1 Tax=Dactylosporangium sp. NPDC051484 TaxID=3154942 RepID=UPI00344FBE37